MMDETGWHTLANLLTTIDDDLDHLDQQSEIALASKSNHLATTR